MRTPLLILGGIVVLVAGIVLAQIPKPNPAVPPHQVASPNQTGSRSAEGFFVDVIAPPGTTNARITWSVPLVTQTIFPGSTSTVAVSFQSNQNLARVVIDITPSLNGIVSATPTSFASITASQSYQITLTLTAPPAFIKRSFGGTIHIRNAGSPPKTYETPLTINLQTGWDTVKDASSGLSFVLPEVGSPPLVNNIGSTSYASFVISVGAVNPSDKIARSLLRIFALPNPSRKGLQEWFEDNVDDASGTLLASGAFQRQQLPNGAALVAVGPIPATYQGGPVAQAYMLPSSTGGRVYAIVQSQDGQLTDFGYSASSAPGILTTILGSVQ